MVRALQVADPRLIGPYRLVGQLGSGGMGRVFLGMSVGGRPVAVKIIRAELAADPEFRSRFSREVAAARRVNGLFTALVVDADVDAPVPWLATAYVPGLSLAETVKERGPLSATSVLSLAAGLAEGLSAIHAAGVVHGDLKPSNVLLAEDGPRVIDFGISRAAGAAPVTPTGLVVGSPGFMSPEQALGKEIGPLSDVFSLGAVLAFAATGQRPFGTGSPVELLDRVIHGSPSLETVPAEVRPLVKRCLDKDPSQRPTAAGLLAEMGAVHVATDWLPESIVRMIPMEIPSSNEDERIAIVSIGGTLTVTLGSVQPDRGLAVGQPQTADEPSAADPPHTVDGPPAARPPQAVDKLRVARPPQAVHGPPAADPLQPGEESHAGHEPQPGKELPAGDGRKPRSRLWRSVAAAGVVGLLAASGAAGYFLTVALRHPSGSPSPSRSATVVPISSTAPISGRTSPSSRAPASRLPEITHVFTYQRGVMVYLEISYTDTGDDAEGFGFVGVNGTSRPEKNYPFSSPSDGVVEPGSITYSFNQECGTIREHASYVKAWVYDSSGARSKSVVVHLVCDS
jgi:eukaryotic-like serine/threonine-protein kinase